MSQVNARAADTSARDSRQRWYALAVCMAGGFIVFLDVSIVNVALPTISATARLRRLTGEIGEAAGRGRPRCRMAAAPPAMPGSLRAGHQPGVHDDEPAVPARRTGPRARVRAERWTRGRPAGRIADARGAPGPRRLGRAGQASDPAGGVVFLGSSPSITGEILHIDGGQAAGH